MLVSTHLNLHFSWLWQTAAPRLPLVGDSLLKAQIEILLLTLWSSNRAALKARFAQRASKYGGSALSPCCACTSAVLEVPVDTFLNNSDSIGERPVRPMSVADQIRTCGVWSLFPEHPWDQDRDEFGGSLVGLALSLPLSWTSYQLVWQGTRHRAWVIETSFPTEFIPYSSTHEYTPKQKHKKIRPGCQGKAELDILKNWHGFSNNTDS